MNNDLLKAYRAERAKDGGYMGKPRAADALRSARCTIANLGADFPRYADCTARLELPRGEYVEMRLEPDSDSDIFERLDVSENDRVADDVADNAGEGWIDRDGRVLWGRGGWGRTDYYLLESGYSLAQRIADRSKYMSRHAAWLHARQSIAQDFDYFRRVLDKGYVGYVATLYDAAGSEVDEDSCWGFEAVDDYAGLECLGAAQCLATRRAQHWVQEVENARAENKRIGAAFSSLAAEYRAARNIGPAVCDAIRAKLAALREEYRANVRTIAGGAA